MEGRGDGAGSLGPRPVERSARAVAYMPQAAPAHVDLFLDSNESPGAAVDLAAVAVELGADGARRYAGPAWLEAVIARRLGVGAERVLVTAGGDQAIDLACRAFLEAGRELVLPVPTFEMIPKYAGLAGATVVRVGWERGAFPVEAVRGAITERTGMVAVVSPNNPTGAVATGSDVRAVCAAARGALVLVDAAYAEFAGEDLTGVALAESNALVVRTFSKAYGLAGLRVGYAVGSARVIGALRATGAPYPVSRIGLAAAGRALALEEACAARGEQGFVGSLVAEVARERGLVGEAVRGVGGVARASEGNFVLVDFGDAAAAERVWQGLRDRGISVRRYGAGSGLEGSLRVTCPGRADWCVRLLRALAEIGEGEGVGR